MTRRAFLIAALLCCLAAPPPPAAAEPPTAAERGSSPVAAADREEDATGDGPPPKTLDAIVVVGRPEGNPSGKNTLNRTTIEALPAANGNAGEILTTLPGVQIDELSRSSETGGEILPAKISISGGLPYRNNFVIDGLGNNSLLDPLADNPNDVNSVPGHPQGLFLQNSLIDEISVYRSNVPARFGHFTGGVVESTTRDPEPVFSGKVFVRTTRDEWTSFHLEEGGEEAFEGSTSHLNQPNFLKTDIGLELNVPLTDGSGLLASYELVESEICLSHFAQQKDQHRKLENLFLKYRSELSSDLALELSGLYTPYRADYFVKDTRDSDFTIRNGGGMVGGALEGEKQWGRWQLKSAYRWSENSRSAPTTWWRWQVTPNKDWGTIVGTTGSQEGGFADLELEQRTWESHADIEWEPLDTGPLAHTLAAGAEVQRTRASLKRETTNVQYTLAAIEPVVDCSLDPVACDGSDTVTLQNQYFTRRAVYEAGISRETLSQFGLYGEDTIAWKDISVRAGVRVSYDDLLRNTDVAPRLTATIDPLAGRTVLTAGWNRYYAAPLLTTKLREGLEPLRLERRSLDAATLQPTAWAPSFESNIRTRLNDLESPYSDEVAFGIDQALLGGRLRLDYIRREGKKELALERTDTQDDGNRYYEFNNNGRTRHREYSAEWSRAWRRHEVILNATCQETDTSLVDDSTKAGYEITLDESDLSDLIFFEGKVLKRDELPRDDFNRPWTLNFIYQGQLPWNLLFTNRTYYRSGYRTIVDSEDETILASGEAVPVFVEERYSDSWVFDWKLSWQPRLGDRNPLTMSAEVLNVFNERAQLGNVYKAEYELGRQFWAGMEYAF